jgi:FlaA1/EpsC-like NDP-sugar epimerase
MLIDPLLAGWLLVLVGLAVFATQEPRHFVLSFNMATQLLIRILNFSLTNEPTIIKYAGSNRCWKMTFSAIMYLILTAKHAIFRKSTSICVFIYYLL